MLINLKVKTLDARTHEFSIDNELTIRQFKDQIAEKTNIAAENQRIIYQGRVLADDKQVKEYDVDGKVLHVAERPPFSQRGANYRNNDEPMRTFRNVSRPTPGSMRTQPYFRALDGMLVGTMAIPVNNHNAAAGARTAPPNRFPNSSSFCINRITVALHMIDCVNNIAAYLENPAVGLNNQSLDILQRGRWSMESTVVEVGVSSTDLPRNNNIIDMVQDAVNAALSRGTNGRNYTVVQLPTVYTNESGETTQQRGNEIDGEGGLAALGGPGSDGSGETTAAAVIIEDVIETDDEAADGASDRSTTPTPDGTDAGDGSDGAFGGEPTGTSSLTAPDTNASGSASADAAASTSAAGGSASNMNVSGIGPRRRTRPQVLANVIQNYRNVQNRLAPFVQRYYEILEQDPVFEESDTAERESAQRIFDRVSEAFHYLSHAQHAISDLMLDLSQPGPRVLTCRPILVEQSGYIRSNNIFAPNLVASPLAELIPNRNPNGGGLVSAQQLLGTLSEPTPPSTSATAVVPSSAVSTATASTASTASNPFQDAATRAHVDAIRANVDAVRSVAQALSSTGSTADQTRSDILSQNLVADLTSEIMHTITNPSTISQDAIHSNGDLRNALARATVDRVIAAGRRFLNSDDVEDPVDEPMVAPSNVSGSASSTPQSPQQPQQPPRPEMDPQVQMARLIQAVVNSSTNDGDVRVEFNSPNIVSINLPVHVMTAAVRPALTGASGASAAPTATATTTAGASPAPPNDIQSRTAARIGELFANVLPAPNANAASTTASTNTAGAGAASTSTGRDQRATNTLPTTATQTRSTSRPQIQLGGNNNWGGRIAPTHTAFDRFLPCNSHHIREPELLAQHNNNNNNNNNRSTTNAAAAQPPPLSSSLSTPGTGIGVAGIPVMAATSQPLTGSIFAAAAAAAAASGAPSHRASAGSANGAEGLTTATAGAGAIGVNTANASGSPSNTATHSPITAPGSTTGTPTGEATTATTASVLSQFGEGTADAIDDQFNELTSIRAQMRTFLYSSLFRGQTINEQTIPGAITRALNWFDDSLIYLPQYERPEYNSRLSLYNIIGQSLRLVFELCSSGGNPFSLSPEASSFSSTGAQFEQRLKHICDQFRQRLYSVLFLCLGSTNAELYWRQLMRILCVPLRSNFYNGALQFLCIYIDPTIPSETDTVDAQQFLVLRTGIPPSALQEQQQMFDTDIEMLDMDAGASSSNTDPEPLPSVTVGAEPWHINFPSEWLPVITRDLQTQTEQNRSQPPYSDAYISGMSAKRRKVIQAEKPTPTVECLIANGVQRAMQGAGINSGNASASSSSSISPDAVIDAIANDDGIQATYTEAVRTNTRERIKQDVDYSPNKYPQIAKFTEQK
ncbi:uncharacterized protein Dwil_GK17390 [Drosophila willistoni]|uniref:Large proline-rich protein BAG6 n=1 Tax=Drosophila willistoni TaxID=7260 RepID=B4MLT9_DROWI|nr:large proline-rich protein BAG6 isoform X2 [Drosophila willistoni]EDW73150.2 uncharacterized protein Dwil_GK17390 [Drosophila willistoni]